MKKIILILTIWLIHSNVFAQFTTQWNSGFTTTNAPNFSHEGRKTVVDANGNTFVMLDATSNMDPAGNATSNTYYYVVLLKYNGSGTLTYQNKINVLGHQVTGYNSVASFGLALDPSGNVYAGYNIVDPLSGSDIIVSKLNNNLVMQWTQKYNPTSTDIGVSMAVNSTGVVYVIGKSTTGSNVTFKIFKTNNITLTVTPVYSFDLNTEVANQIILDGSSNVYVTGYKIVSTTKSIMTASCDNAGTLRWKSISNGGSSNRDDFGKNLVLGNDGYIYVLGNSDRGLPTGTNFDNIVIKHFAPTGKKIWENYYTLNNVDNSISILNFDPGYLIFASSAYPYVMFTRIDIAAGLTSGRYIYQPKPASPFTAVTNRTISDFKVSANLRVYMTGTMTSSAPNGLSFNAGYLTKFAYIAGSRPGFSILEEANAVGDFGNSFSSVAMALNTPNNSVSWIRDIALDYVSHAREIVDIISIESAVSMRDGNNLLSESNENNDIKVYPTVTNNIVFIESQIQIQAVQVINSIGQIVKSSGSFSENSIESIDLSQLNNGIYFIKIRTTDNSESNYKIVKN